MTEQQLRVAVCPYVFHENKVFLIYKSGKNVWVPPGGHAEPGETLSEALHRELFEETGLRARFPNSKVQHVAPGTTDEPVPFRMMSAPSKFGGKMTTLEFAGILEGSAVPTLDVNEALEGKWWPIDNLEGVSPIIQERIRFAQQFLEQNTLR